jgi:hypothetical protein
MAEISTGVGLDSVRAVALVEHYQKTAELVTHHWERRSRQFVTLVAVLAGAALVAFTRPLIAPALQELFLKYVTLSGPNLDRLTQLTPVAGDLLLAFLVVTVFYLTTSLVNRTSMITNYYLYMGLLEGEIRGALYISRDQFAFAREGAFYRIAGSPLSRLIARCYKVVLGALLVFFFAARLFFDYPADIESLPPLERAAILTFVAKTFLFVVDVLVVVPTMWLYVRFVSLRAISQAEARERLSRIET